MKVLVVFDHPRPDSFCGSVRDAFLAGLDAAGHTPEVADLRADGFDPRMPLSDEPDWDNREKVYSAAVRFEQARILRNDAIAFVFPVWWWSFPATTKGWIDRVWNNGWAYGGRRLSLRGALLIATASGARETYADRGFEQAMRIQLLTGIMEYCGIGRSELRLLDGVMDGEATRDSRLAMARELGNGFHNLFPEHP